MNSKTPQTFYHQVFHSNGWIESWTEPENPIEALASYREQFLKDTLRHDVYEKLKSEFVRIQSSNIKIIFFRMPSSPQMEDLENVMGNFKYQELENILTSTGAIHLQFDSKNYHSYDGSHLHKDSAVQFSLELGAKIKEIINATR